MKLDFEPKIIEITITKTEEDFEITNWIETFRNNGYWLHELFRESETETLTFCKNGYIPIGCRRDDKWLIANGYVEKGDIYVRNPH